MRKSFWTIFVLLFSLAIGGNVWSQAILLPEFADLDTSIMRPDREIRLQWIDDYERAPAAITDKEIELRLTEAQAQVAGTSLSLLNYLQYNPSQRSQGSCGNCWVWADNGIMEIALNVQSGIKDQLSIQFLNSCKTDEFACCGGNPSTFASWYGGLGFSIPWSNTNASYQDSSTRCSNQASAVPCGSIGTAPNYPITSIQAQVIQTTGVGQSTAIANIKNILNQNRGIYFGFYLADLTDWNAFYNFWGNQGESTLWNPDDYCGHTWVEGQGGGHGVLMVGYNDEDSNPANHYWVILNSWGTAGGNRPNGLFRVPMYMNYDCKIHESHSDWYSREFWTLGVTFNPSVEPKPNLTPYKPPGWSDKIVVSTSTGTQTDISPLYTTDTLYVDWAVINDSDVPITSRFYVALYADGVLKTTWYWDSFNAHAVGAINDYSLGSLSAGAHTIKIAVDSTGIINESNEGDNEYTKVITVQGSETISIPSNPTGPTIGNIGTNYTYSTGSSSSNLGHFVEYHFDWGDGSYSNWSSSASGTKSWSSAGTYVVKAQARCATDLSVVSNWSGPLNVTISAEAVSAPSLPNGTTNGVVGVSYSYSTGGSVSNAGHAIEYRFDWGDGSYSNWSSSASGTKSWSSAGTYVVKAQARCATDLSVVSNWSGPLNVTISAEAVSAPSLPNGTANGVVGVSYSYSTGGSVSNAGHAIEYRFDWGGGNYSNWSSAIGATKSWSSAGTYVVKAQARCATDLSVVSNWSGPLNVTISAEAVSAPSLPNGTTNGVVGVSYSYSTGGSVSNAGHAIEYRFDWGGGNYSNWSSSASGTKSWSSAGTYVVKAQARCATDLSVVSNWSGPLNVTISAEAVSAPSLPNGTTNGVVGVSYSYSTGGSVSNAGHAIEYRFDWGGGNYSNWSSAIGATKSWSSPGTYVVKAQARCATDLSVVSNWSGPLNVTISAEAVSAPSVPSGTTNGAVGVSYNYSTGGSVSNVGHAIEYRFDWGDGNYSSWSSATSTTKSWSSAGTYVVKAQARCAHDMAVISGWSPGLGVNITAPISLQSPSSEAVFDVCSLYSLPTFSWTIGEVFKGYEIQFSSDKSFGSPPAVKVKVPGTTTQKTMSSTTWKRIILIPGASGGKLYWRFVGTRANKSPFTSEVRSIVVEPPQEVGSPNILNTRKSLFPALSWENNCNTKFVTWFAGDSGFTKKIGYTFNIKNPNENNGIFKKVLTSAQWEAIRKLVEDVNNSAIYWYVESFDKLKRDAKTDVMSFVLLD